jgi:dynein heavy chain
MHGTCIETAPQHAEGEDEPVVFSFFTDIASNQAIIELVTTVTKSVQNTLGSLNKYLNRWKRYRLLWKLDKVCITFN